MRLPRSFALRAGLTIAVLSVAGPSIVFAARTGVAAWLVFPGDVPNAETRMRALGTLERARRLAPGEAMYSFYIARRSRNLLRSRWLDEAAVEHLRRATRAATRAAELVRTNPFFHSMRATVALDGLEHPRVPDTERDSFLETVSEGTERALAEAPFHPLLHQQVGMELLRAWEWLGELGREQALDALRRAAELEPGRHQRALADLWLEAVRLDRPELLQEVTPADPASRRRLAEFLEYRAIAPVAGDPRWQTTIADMALQEYLRAAELAELQEAHVETWIDAWRRLYPEDSKGFLQAAHALTGEYPGDPMAWVALAEAYGSNERPDDRMDALDRAVGLAEEDSAEKLSAAMRRRADLLLRQQRFEEALEDFERLADLEPDDPGARIRAARCLDRLGRDEEALEWYRAAVRVAPRSAAARTALARAYLQRFEYLDAIREFRAVVAMQPGSVGPRVEIARAYVELGLLDQAIRAYDQALELDPDNARVRREMRQVVERLPGR